MSRYPATAAWAPMKKSGGGDCFVPPRRRQERFACQEGGLVRYRFTVEHGFRKRDVEFLDPRISHRDRGTDNRIDDKAIAIGGTLDSFRGPRESPGVFRHDAEKDAGVDQYGRHSVIAGQRHDGFGAHHDVAAAVFSHQC
jgi:hypothetical protein